MLTIVATPSLRWMVMITAVLLMLSACGGKSNSSEFKTGTLTQNLAMVDREGRTYGTVSMTPVGGGRIYDTEGRVIGDIVPPER